MHSSGISELGRRTKSRWFFVVALLSVAAGFVLSGTGEWDKTNRIGKERLVSWEAMPEMDGAACEWIPASASTSLAAALQQSPGGQEAAPPRPSEQARGEVSKRDHVLHIQVVADAFPVLERPVFFPNQRGLLGDMPIVIDAILRHRDHEAVDVSTHGLLLSVRERASAAERVAELMLMEIPQRPNAT